jgi:predicted PhzF superfamily epimerase YddE/YHI9
VGPTRVDLEWRGHDLAYAWIKHRMINLGGVRMRRPSRIVLSIEGVPDAITRVRIGGTSVLVAEGALHL